MAPTHWEGGLFGYPVRRRSQSSWSSTSCCHHPGAGPSELSTPSGPTQPHWGQSGLPALGLTPMARAAGRNRTQTLAVMSPTSQPLGHTAASDRLGGIFVLESTTFPLVDLCTTDVFGIHTLAILRLEKQTSLLSILSCNPATRNRTRDHLIPAYPLQSDALPTEL